MADSLTPDDQNTVETIQESCVQLTELLRQADDPEVQARLEEAVHNAEIALEIVYGYRDV